MPIIRPKVSAYLIPSPTIEPLPKPIANMSPQPQPQGASGRGGVTYTAGPSEIATTTYLTGQTDGPVTATGQRLDAYVHTEIEQLRLHSGTSQYSSVTVSRRAEFPGVAGGAVTVSLWVRYDIESPFYNIGARLRVTLHDGSTVIGEDTGDRALLGPAGTDWRRISATVVAPASFTHVGWTVVFDGPAPEVGSAIDLTGVLIERGGLGPYFDGETPTYEWGGYLWSHYWLTTPYYSTSVAHPSPADPPASTRLSVVGARIALDRRWVPYAQAVIQVAENVASLANPARSDPPRLALEVTISAEWSLTLAHITNDHFGDTLAALSARYVGRTLADVTADYSTPYNPDDGSVVPTEQRVFDLGVREAEWSTSAASTSIVAASDEALAQDYRLVSRTPTELYGPPHNPNDGDSILTQALRRIGAAFAGYYQPSGHPSHAGATDVPLEDRVWEPGVSLWDYISGVASPGGWRVWCDERRLWAAEHTTVASRQRKPRTHRLYPTTSIVRRSREPEQWADAIVARFQWTDAGGTRRERYLTAQQTTMPTKVRYVSLDRQPSQALVDRLLRSALNSESFAETELDAPPLIGVTPGDTLDLGDYALTCLAVEWTFPDNTMKVKA